MASFVLAHKVVGKTEGGYTDNPKDKGNWVDGKLIGTKYGISARVLKTELGRTPTVDDMKRLSAKASALIYKNNYWDKIDGDNIKNQSVALIIYDASVNQGLYATKSMVRNALSKQNIKLDNFDAKKINKANQKELFDNIYKQRESRYVKGNPAFVKGWLNRLSEIKYAKTFSGKKSVLIILTVLTIGSIGFFVYKGLKK